jgi:hypothetical protein
VADWFQSTIVDRNKLPIFLCAVAFIVTFAITRWIVKSIRRGTGHLKDNVVGGLHIHHAVPGVILMIAGGLGGLAAEATFWRSLAGIGFGIGLALVLDEFALILHLEDVYWTEQGRTSVDAVLLAGAVLVLVVLGADPFAVESDSEAGASGTAIIVIVNICFALVCFLKGKIGTGVIGIVVPIVGIVGAWRIARPRSPWAMRRYPEGGHKAEKARSRELSFDDRWRSKLRTFQDKVAGFGS